MWFSTKRSVYSDIPSFLSQSAICCMAVTKRSRRVMTEISTTEPASLYKSIGYRTPADFHRRFRSILGFNWGFPRLDGHAKLLSTPWCGQLTRLSGRRHSRHQNRDCRTAIERQNMPSHVDAQFDADNEQT